MQQAVVTALANKIEIDMTAGFFFFNSQLRRLALQKRVWLGVWVRTYLHFFFSRCQIFDTGINFAIVSRDMMSPDKFSFAGISEDQFFPQLLIQPAVL